MTTALVASLFSTSLWAQAVLPLADAEVRKIDLAAQKITLRHGEIKNLDMPPMSMVFKVSDPAFLGKLKPGDRVQFTADNLGGALTILSIERATP
jgi:Cu/Ag efflux protein CusF